MSELGQWWSHAWDMRDIVTALIVKTWIRYRHSDGGVLILTNYSLHTLFKAFLETVCPCPLGRVWLLGG